MLAVTLLAAALWAPPAAASAESITVAALHAHAAGHAPALALAAVDGARADAERRAAQPWAPDDPEVELGVGLRRRGAHSGLDFEVRLAQPIDVSGERGLRRAAARALGEQATAALSAARWRLRAEVEAAAVESWLAAERHAWASEAAALADRLTETARRRVEAGAAPGADLILAEVEQRSAHALRVDAEQREIAIRGRLAVRIGWPAPVVPPITPALPPLAEPAPAAALLARLEGHPALVASDRRIAAVRSRLAAAERAGWPDPTVAIGFTREAGGGHEPDADIWSAGVGLPLPLWRGADAEIARARVDVRHAEAARAALAADLKAALLDARAEVERSFTRARLLGEGLAPLQAHDERVDAAYGRGEIDLMTRLQIRRARTEAENAALDARAEYHRARARLTRRAGPPTADRTVEEAAR